MTVVSIANSRWGPSLGRSLVRIFPTRLVTAAADWLAAYLARQTDSPLVEAIRSNQAVVRGIAYDDPRLDEAVVSVLRKVGRGYISLFSLVDKKAEELDLSSRIDSTLLEPGLRALEAGRGLFFAAAHTAGFDQLLVMLGSLEYPVQALSAAEPTGSYIVQNEMRMKFGVDLTPVSMAALRKALGILRNGGIVATAVDRPDQSGEQLEFFGMKARMPIGHARLCVKTGAPILVGYTRETAPGEYRAYGVDLLYPASKGDESTAAIDLAQRVLRALETAIREQPGEWLMFHPVWPSVIPAGKVS
jgi:KDO2-lipid IV(A) lauroyltransferase